MRRRIRTSCRLKKVFEKLKKYFKIIILKGDILKLIKKVDGAWWEGELVKNQTRGWFPSNYVRELKQTEIDKLKKDNKTLELVLKFLKKLFNYFKAKKRKK